MASDKSRVEGEYTRYRIEELRERPVRGVFDAAHLREINRRIFQDLPRFGLDYRPGEYRAAVMGGDWYKARRLESRDTSYIVAYSDMRKNARNRLDDVLRSVKPDTLKSLKTADFTKTLGEFYADLDQIHPFPDGNSRTLREFTRQLAAEAGYDIHWERFSVNRYGRDVLYVARDLSVNERSYPHLKHPDIKRDVAASLIQLATNRDLPDLLRDAIRPSRAIAFEKDDRQTALERFPELAAHYALLDRAHEQASARFPRDLDGVAGIVADIKNRTQERLDAGEISIHKDKQARNRRSTLIEREEDGREEGHQR